MTVKKVLIITLTFPPVSGPGAQRILKFVKYLPEYNWCPIVIASVPEKGGWTVEARRDFSLCEEVSSDTQIYRIKWNGLEDYAFFLSALLANFLYFIFLCRKKKSEIMAGLSWRMQRLLHHLHPEPLFEFISKSFIQALIIARRDKIDICLTSGPPHNVHFVGFLLKLFLGIKWVADFRDPWSGCDYIEQPLGIRKILIPVEEKLILNAANIVTTVSNGCADIFKKKVAYSKESNIRLIVNGYDETDIPKDDFIMLTYDKLHIHYNGNLRLNRDLSYILQALIKIKKSNPQLLTKINFTFTGIPQEQLNNIAAFKFQNLFLDIGHCDHKKSLLHSMSSDVLLLISHKYKFHSSVNMTGKVYEYIALGKPILALIPKGGDLSKFLAQYNHSEIVEYDDIDAIAFALEDLLKKKIENKLSYRDPPEWIADYSRKNQTFRLVQAMNELFK